MKQSTALDILKAGHNVFLTGSAGAGKTYTLNQYIQYLKARKIPVAVTASTGIAATHMNGMTIHTWSGMGIKEHLTDSELKTMRERKYLREHIEKAKVLIIDEISMLHAKQFNLVNQILKFFKNNHETFGGMQIIVSGDFFQLPPVSKNGEPNREKFAFMSEAWLEAQFKICYLTEQHRQEDNHLDQILNAIRAQNIQPEHIAQLKNTFHHQQDGVVTRLFTHNADVDSLNQDQLANIDGKSYQFSAKLEGNEKLLETLKSAVRAPEILTLKKHAKVMFVKNNFDMGYVNGSVAEVIGFIDDNELGVLPKVEFNDGNQLVVEPETWSIDDDEGKTLASFTQIPLRLAWAITIHKSQGMTLQSAEIDLSQTFEKGQGYVALSRLKCLTGLKLLGFQDHALQLDSLAVKADKRFQELSQDAENLISALSPEQLEKLHQAYIKHCGGITDSKEIQRQSKKLEDKSQQSSMHNTLEETKALFLADYDIEDIAVERGLTRSTIITHLGKLMCEQALDISRVQPEDEDIERVRKAYKKLQKRGDEQDLNDDGTVKLRPLVEMTSLSYEKVRLALLFVV
ncbi:AAA family ATPase [Acinetobacter sp. c3-l95]|uniref:AAA family ATPase n=1 Tax=Acinetobacter sp. c3-l95 TaxID=3342804 RepID=UPI0035BA98E1